MEDRLDVSFLYLKVCKPLYIFTSKILQNLSVKIPYFGLKPGTNLAPTWHQQKNTHNQVYNYLILFKIHPSLTTSKEGLKKLNIHLETTSF